MTMAAPSLDNVYGGPARGTIGIQPKMPRVKSARGSVEFGASRIMLQRAQDTGC